MAAKADRRSAPLPCSRLSLSLKRIMLLSVLGCPTEMAQRQPLTPMLTLSPSPEPLERHQRRPASLLSRDYAVIVDRSQSDDLVFFCIPSTHTMVHRERSARPSRGAVAHVSGPADRAAVIHDVQGDLKLYAILGALRSG